MANDKCRRKRRPLSSTYLFSVFTWNTEVGSIACGRIIRLDELRLFSEERYCRLGEIVCKIYLLLPPSGWKTQRSPRWSARLVSIMERAYPPRTHPRNSRTLYNLEDPGHPRAKSRPPVTLKSISLPEADSPHLRPRKAPPLAIRPLRLSGVWLRPFRKSQGHSGEGRIPIRYRS